MNHIIPILYKYCKFVFCSEQLALWWAWPYFGHTQSPHACLIMIKLNSVIMGTGQRAQGMRTWQQGRSAGIERAAGVQTAPIDMSACHAMAPIESQTALKQHSPDATTEHNLETSSHSPFGRTGDPPWAPLLTLPQLTKTHYTHHYRHNHPQVLVKPRSAMHHTVSQKTSPQDHH